MSRLRYVREVKSLTQTGLASLLNVTSSYISQAERGDKELGRDILLKLRKVLGVNIDWFLTGEGEVFIGEKVQNIKSDTVSDLSMPKEIDTVLNARSDVKPEANQTRNVADLRSEKGITHENGNVADLATIATRQGLPEWGGDSAGLKNLPGRIAPLPLDNGFSNLADPREIVTYRFHRGSVEPQEVHAPDPEGAVFLPLYNQAASAGPGQDVSQLPETERTIPVLYQLLGSHRPQFCGVVKVVGDSMADVGLFNGDYVVFDRSDNTGDGIFVISMWAETRVKRLQYRLADKKIVIASENAKRYPDPEVVPVECLERGDLLIHGRVFGWMHRHPY